MIHKEMLTPHIWAFGERWKVEQVISPTRFDDYILLSQATDEIHGDGSTPIYMVLLDAHNQEFYPDTPKVRKFFAETETLNKQREAHIGLGGDLTSLWLRLIAEKE